MQEFYSNGKLLISGEYTVLDGALAFACPTKFGQKLSVALGDTNLLHWQSFDADSTKWFDAKFNIADMLLKSTSDENIGKRLQQILKIAQSLNPNFLASNEGYQITTTLTFPKNWGLGTSSTLINNIANWAAINPYTLLQQTFGGSGYDIACAQHNTPIFYQLNNNLPKVEQIAFNPIFKHNLYFVFLNQKQNSRAAIQAYRKQDFDKDALIQEITAITNALVTTDALSNFEMLLIKHEQLLSKVLGITPVQQRLFDDYFGMVKSLGAWGGDFVLATGNEKTPEYFRSKGFSTILSFQEMLL